MRCFAGEIGLAPNSIRKMCCLHDDLRARHFLIRAHGRVKLTDFGRSTNDAKQDFFSGELSDF
jgi:hypothetical protein